MSTLVMQARLHSSTHGATKRPRRERKGRKVARMEKEGKWYGERESYMQSAWNSCPHGNLITLLTPSTYSSKHTTHSTCLPMYFLHSAEKSPAPFSNPERRFILDVSCGISVGIDGLAPKKLGLSKTPVVVLERGRDLDIGVLCCKRGVVGVAPVGEDSRGDMPDATAEGTV